MFAFLYCNCILNLESDNPERFLTSGFTGTKLVTVVCFICC
ncbi:hypothetical protein RchiOBHm_Chr7g0237011 [Rosa chinensis]|uniref:Uncharacterized protein n=1 Tax=Rosa chinensis TaxID=74649 RepID=A0A2P6PH37_ROSCH|nr:hypothetical protein RchiOBHm_Chr7g0237011 [Rosa chinensis]